MGLTAACECQLLSNVPCARLAFMWRGLFRGYLTPCTCCAPLQFQEMKEANDGKSPLLTQEQQQWLQVQRLLASATVEVRAHLKLACNGAASVLVFAELL